METGIIDQQHEALSGGRQQLQQLLQISSRFSLSPDNKEFVYKQK